MADELEKLLSEEPGKETPKTASTEEKKSEVDPVLLKRQEELTNIEKAKKQALDDLRKLREDIKKEKGGKVASEEDNTPRIDLNDPSAKAWDKHIKDTVAPFSGTLEKEKQEIMESSLEDFLADKPALAKNPDKLKELMQTYEKISTASGRTKEGVLKDLKKSFAAIYHDELISAARGKRIERAQVDAMFSSPAVSGGATHYGEDKGIDAPLSEDDRAVLQKWGMTESEWREMKKKQK